MLRVVSWRVVSKVVEFQGRSVRKEGGREGVGREEVEGREGGVGRGGWLNFVGVGDWGKEWRGGREGGREGGRDVCVCGSGR